MPMRRLRFESLEARRLLAVDLAVVDVQFVDPTDWFGSATGTLPVEGQKIALRAEVQHTGLTTNDSYLLRFDIDGVTLDVQENLPGFSSFFLVRDGWVAQPDLLHTITVTIDPDDAIAEMDEANNSFSFEFTPDAPASLPQKFVNPVAGVENVDWIVNGYVDVDPEFCSDCDEDFRGNSSLTRDFHNGIDFGLINFAQADQGVDVLAAADGTVILSQDGNFDRWTSFQFPIPEGNRVFIDHGGGWVTQYYHLQRGSVTVSNGDPVTAGQVIGRIGSSGNSAGPHLHFEVQRNHSPVEPFISPDDYFADPAAYTYDVDPVLHDLGITTAFPYFRDILELPSDNDALPTQSVSLSPWVVLSSIEPGDTWELKIFRPNGTEYVQPAFAVPIEFAADIEGSWQWNRWWNLFLDNPEAGNWRAELLVNGLSVGEETFVVGQALPELRVIEDVSGEGTAEFDEPLIIDGRATPLDFGSAAESSTGPAKQFIVENHGFADLTIDSVQVPAGFLIAEGLDTMIAADSRDTFTIELDTTVMGEKSGTLRIVSNDRAASDLDADGDVDGTNFLQWQRGFGITSGATLADGDINADGAVNADDLSVLQEQYASSTETLFEFYLEGEVTAPLTTLLAFPLTVESQSLTFEKPSNREHHDEEKETPRRVPCALCSLESVSTSSNKASPGIPSEESHEMQRASFIDELFEQLDVDWNLIAV